MTITPSRLCAAAALILALAAAMAAHGWTDAWTWPVTLCLAVAALALGALV